MRVCFVGRGEDVGGEEGKESREGDRTCRGDCDGIECRQEGAVGEAEERDSDDVVGGAGVFAEKARGRQCSEQLRCGMCECLWSCGRLGGGCRLSGCGLGSVG